MSCYFYICHAFPNDGLVKVGISTNPTRRIYNHAPLVVVDRCWRFASEEIARQVETMVVNTFSPLSIKKNGTRVSEWLQMFPEEVTHFVKLYLEHHRIDHDLCPALEGLVKHTTSATVDGLAPLFNPDALFEGL